MKNIVYVRKMMQDVLLFVWFKHGALSEEPLRESGLIPDISDEFMNHLSASIWIESFRTKFIWDDFFKNHFKHMTSSSELFAIYFAYACYILKASENVHESFFDILSIVSEFSLRCLEGDCTEYLKACVDLFCTFFKRELSEKFKINGGWEKFDGYIRKQYNSIQSKSTISDHEALLNLFEYFPRALERGNRSDYVNNSFLLKKRQKPYYVVNGKVLKDITQNEVETHKETVNFARIIQSELEKVTNDELFIEFEKTYRQIVESKTKAGVTALPPKKQIKKKQCYSQDVRKYPDEKQRNVITIFRDKDKKSGGIKSREEIDETQRNKSSGVIKNLEKQCSSLDVRQCLDVKQSNAITSFRNKNKKYSGEIENREELNVTQRNKDIKSSVSIKNQVEQRSSHQVPKPLAEIKNQVEQRSSHQVPKLPAEENSRQAMKQEMNNKKSRQNRRGKNKEKAENISSKEALQNPVRMQSNQTQREKDKESSVGTENERKLHSLYVNGVSETVSSKTNVMVGKAATAQDPLQNHNSDIINLQSHVAPVQASHHNLKSRKIELIQKLIAQMILLISNLSNLILFLAEKNRVQVSMHFETKH